MKSRKQTEDIASIAHKVLNQYPETPAARRKGSDKTEHFEFDISYILKYQEAYEMGELLERTGNVAKQKVLRGLILAAGCIMILLFLLNPSKWSYLILGFVTLLLFCQATVKNRKKVKKSVDLLMKETNQYRIKIVSDGSFRVGANESIPFVCDRKARAVEGKLIFVARPDWKTTICIPKRCLNQKKQEQIRTLFEKYYSDYSQYISE